jgi:hypothetical protein
VIRTSAPLVVQVLAMASVVLTRILALASASRTAIVCALASGALLALRSWLGWRGLNDLQHACEYPLLVSLVLWAGAAGCSAAVDIRRLARGRAAPRNVMGLAQHVSYAVGLTAYVWGGLGMAVQRITVSRDGTNVHGESYRVLGVDSSIGREWARRPITVLLERTSSHGTERLRVGYGQDWSSASGKYRLALSRHATVTTGVTMRHGSHRVLLRPGQRAGNIVLHHLHDPRLDPDAGCLEAEVTVGSRRTKVPFDPEWMGETAFVGLEESSSVELLVRRRASTAAAAVASVSVLAMVAFAWLGRARTLRRLE